MISNILLIDTTVRQRGATGRVGRAKLVTGGVIQRPKVRVGLFTLSVVADVNLLAGNAKRSASLRVSQSLSTLRPALPIQPPTRLGSAPHGAWACSTRTLAMLGLTSSEDGYVRSDVA